LGQRSRLWLNDRQGIGRLLAIAFAVFVAVTAIITERTLWTIALEPFALRTILPLWPVLTLWAVLTLWSVLTLWAVLTVTLRAVTLRAVTLRAVTLRAVTLRPVALRPITLLEALALLARFAVTVPAKIAVTITARLVLTTLSSLVLTRILTRLLLTRLWSLILTRLLVADFSLLRLDLIVAVLVLEIDVEARSNRITSENFSRRTVRLNRP
jgi:hypothetical protein